MIATGSGWLYPEIHGAKFALPARPVDEPRWHEGREDFEFERVRYAFATLVVQR